MVRTVHVLTLNINQWFNTFDTVVCFAGALAGAKGCSQLNALLARGISASASIETPENVLQGIMYISSTDLVKAHEHSIMISERTGQATQAVKLVPEKASRTGSGR